MDMTEHFDKLSAAEKRSLKVFLCHAHSDKDAVKALYAQLKREGVDAWLDKEKLLPGQDWELEIRKAVREADVVVVCLSKQFNQAGFRQKEVRIALDAAMEKPEGEIFIIPARLEECDTLESLSKWHWVDLFEGDGFPKINTCLAHSRGENRCGVTPTENYIPPENQPQNRKPKNKGWQKSRRTAKPLKRLLVRRRKKKLPKKPALEAEELERQRIAKEQVDREVAEKAALEKVERETVEKAAHEKAEKEAVEKARLEAEELARRKATKEKAEREATEKATREKAKREVEEKARRDNAKREEIETKPSLKPEIQKPQDNSNAVFWVVGGIFVIILVVWLSSLNGTPSAPAPTSIPTKISTPTAYVGSLSTEITDAKGVPMRLVPAGDFEMGSISGQSDETPVHTVYLDDFYMDKYEVTNTIYKACVEAGSCTQPQDTSSHIAFQLLR